MERDQYRKFLEARRNGLTPSIPDKSSGEEPKPKWESFGIISHREATSLQDTSADGTPLFDRNDPDKGSIGEPTTYIVRGRTKGKGPRFSR